MSELMTSLSEYLGGKGYERYRKRLCSELMEDELSGLLENLKTNFKRSD